MQAAVTTLLLAAGASAATCEWYEGLPSEPNSCRNMFGASQTSDGFCDDGGPGSDYSICNFGTDTVDCGDRYSNGTEGISCLKDNQHNSGCWGLAQKTSCWKDVSDIEGSTIWTIFDSEICCATSSDDCCEANVGLIAGIVVFLCFLICGSCLCCIFLPCCKCCPCNKTKKRGAPQTPSAQQPNSSGQPGMAMQPGMTSQPVDLPMVAVGTPMAVATPTACTA